MKAVAPSFLSSVAAHSPKYEAFEGEAIALARSEYGDAQHESDSDRITKALDDGLPMEQESLVAYAAETPAKHNLMIWTTAIHSTRVVRNIILVYRD